MMASLCTETMKFVRNRGFATLSHRARAGLMPCSRASRGTSHMQAITASTHIPRNQSTPASGSAPVTATTNCSSHRKSGP